ncbi:MAG: SurA N-terminal domain-containing protein [Rhodobacterales bacterium]|nr:SurA N-terminal domain-containing protein [Rhodobacterales bacterium]
MTHPKHLFSTLSATLLIAISVVFTGPAGANAQNLFKPVITVNNKIITRYEMTQRVQLLKLLGAKAGVIDLARQQLIEERLKLEAAEAIGLVVTEEGIQAGIEEFATNANLTPDKLLAALAAGGVSAQTFYDFVKAGITWRELIQAKFGPRVQINDNDIDRALKQSSPNGPLYTAIEYAAYYIPGGRSDTALAEAAKIRARVDTCDDLYGVAYGQPDEVLERGVKAPADIPADIARELNGLDKHEISTNLTRANGSTLVLLMLCGRTVALGADIPRENVALQLQNQRLVTYSQSYLAELRADARIVIK